MALNLNTSWGTNQTRTGNTGKEHKEHARKRNRQIDKTQAYIDEA